jgi:hypothetical protein
MPQLSPKNRLTSEDREVLGRLISLEQTGGLSESVEIDRDFLLQDGNYDLYFLNYFPNEVQSFEPMNYQFLDFLENERQGMAWLPGTWGKSTTLRLWTVYVTTRDPQVSFIYTEKSEPAASSCARALMDIYEFNTKLIHDFGEFKSRWWSADALTIKQRPNLIKSPTVAFFGAQSKATLGSRTNIMIVDDPVTADNSTSDLERARLWDWYSQAAATCPSPLPLTNERYLKKLFLVGTTFHMADLYHEVLKTNMYKHLHLKAIDLTTGHSNSPRFTYATTEELKERAETNEVDALLLQKVLDGKITSLGDFRKSHGTKAFMRRYQNEVLDDSTAKFPSLWFRGGKDDWSPPGGYPGCLENDVLHPLRSLGERPDGKKLTCCSGVDPFGGVKGANTARFACVTLGRDFDKDPGITYVMDIDFGTQPMVSDNPGKYSQVDIVLQHAKDYDSRVVLETNNVQSAWAAVLRQEAQRRGTSITITGHTTTLQKKVDPQLGVEAMTAMIENGQLRLPYRSAQDKKSVDELIEEFIYWGFYPTDDILMAFWFAWRALERISRSKVVVPVEDKPKAPFRFMGNRWSYPPSWTGRDIENFHNRGTNKSEEIDDA